MKISIELYGTEKAVSSTEDAFQNLLIENILNPGHGNVEKPRIADLRVAARVRDERFSGEIQRRDEADFSLLRSIETSKTQRYQG